MCVCVAQGVEWGPAEKKQWFQQQSIKRSYQEQVLSKLEAFKADFEVVQYGKLTLSVNDYPVFAVKTRDWDNAKQTVLVTGGIHGYETSGVQVRRALWCSIQFMPCGVTSKLFVEPFLCLVHVTT